jgi:hypothetical protein
MELIFEISDDPISGLKRKVQLKSNPINYIDEATDTNFLVSYWQNVGGAYGDKITGNASLDPNQRFREFPVTITANGIMVDPITMVEKEKIYYDENDNIVPFDSPLIVRWEYEAGGISEFMYFANMKASYIGLTDPTLLAFLTALYSNLVTTADIKGRFN